jgi:glycosyltransferase involved in cell wall biosynthesis
MKFSLIISTRGRVVELKRLFHSLTSQTLQDFEVIISDQNQDDRLTDLAIPSELDGRVLRLRNSGGLSRGRNEGIKEASGEILGFPDDDCAYPPKLLSWVADFFETHPEFGFFSGRSYADDGGDSVSRHAKQASEISRYRIHTQCIEFAIFIKRSHLGDLRFDENMGVGALSPWQSDEGPDLLLRLRENGVRGYYDPQLGAWHPRPVLRFDTQTIDRTYRYACGNGYFYRKHHYPGWFFAYQMFRTAGGLALALVLLKIGKARLYYARLRGRWRGWSYNQGRS